jgi:hypothetical protein
MRHEESRDSHHASQEEPGYPLPPTGHHLLAFQLHHLRDHLGEPAAARDEEAAVAHMYEVVINVIAFISHEIKRFLDEEVVDSLDVFDGFFIVLGTMTSPSLGRGEGLKSRLYEKDTWPIFSFWSFFKTRS